ncbi:MAG: RNA polymerase sigma factor [Bacteroidales bacterium]|nr:RNA polymerase sigma factor [Bacteroidales bacterium]MBN2818061.1 RNA polymerase sigma factor [Bacteroidales bacterium]
MTVAEYNLCVENHADGIYRFILKNLRDSDRAQDVVQETFAKLWVKYAEVNFGKAKSYLFTTAYHTMIDMIRKDKHTDEIDTLAAVPSTRDEQYSDLKEVLDEAVNMLPEDQRSVLLLRDYEGYNYKEIEEITGLNESQVKVYIYRARKYLMNYIGSMEKVL